MPRIAKFITLCGDVPLICALAWGDTRHPGGSDPRGKLARAIRLGGALRARRRNTAVRDVPLFVLLLFTPRQVLAQSGDHAVMPEELFLPERGEGARIAPGFVLYPAVSIEAAHDSNIYNVDSDKRADEIIKLRPSLRLASDFSRHGIELKGNAEFRRFARNSGENAESFDLAALGRLELGGRIDVVPEIGYAKGFEYRGTAGDQFLTDRPITYHAKTAALSISRSRGRLALAVKGRIANVRYADASIDGVPIDLADRDVTRRQASVRTALRLHQQVEAFVEVGGNQVDYRKRLTRPRDSSGYSVLGGARLEIGSLVDLEAALGYIRQDFRKSAYKPVSGINYRLSGRWSPRPTWLIKAAVQRSIDSSPRDDTPAILRSEYQLSAQRAFGNRLIMEGQAAHVREDYRTTDRTDRNFRIGLTAHYRLIPNVGLSGGVAYRKQDGGRLGRSYNGISGAVTLRALW